MRKLPPPTNFPEESRSIAAALTEMAERGTALKLSFHDFHGIFSDIPALKVNEENLRHCCSLCSLSKRDPDTAPDCMANKLAVNRLALRRRNTFSGQCHLGLTDIVSALFVRGRAMGVLYFGSVVVKGTEKNAVRRIERYSKRKGISPAELLDALNAAPVVSPEELQRGVETATSLVDVIGAVLEFAEIPLQHYRNVSPVGKMQPRKILPALTQRATGYIERNYREPITRNQLAAVLNCHPNHLSRIFTRHMGCGLAEYLSRVRIHHAKMILVTRKLNVAETCFEVGFNDQSHFTRVFKQVTGITPGEYARNVAAAT